MRRDHLTARTDEAIARGNTVGPAGALIDKAIDDMLHVLALRHPNAAVSLHQVVATPVQAGDRTHLIVTIVVDVNDY
jgi:hypothetical protein